jgi:hypothetical protein
MSYSAAWEFSDKNQKFGKCLEATGRSPRVPSPCWCRDLGRVVGAPRAADQPDLSITIRGPGAHKRLWWAVRKHPN